MTLSYVNLWRLVASLPKQIIEKFQHFSSLFYKQLDAIDCQKKPKTKRNDNETGVKIDRTFSKWKL